MSLVDEDKISVPLFELVTKGDSVNGWQLKGRSKKVYLDKQEAASGISSFEEQWYDTTEFEYAIPGTLKTEIVERELIVSRHTLERILRENS